MSETKKTNERVDVNEDWAVLPFDEAEDRLRWARLSAEMDGLEKEVDAHEAVHGKILMEEDFSRFQTNDNARSLAKYDEAFEDNPF
jgi:hypothetical protein